MLRCSVVSDSSPPHGLKSPMSGILQARTLEWPALSFSKESSQPRNQTHISCDSCFGQCILYDYATWEALEADVTALWPPGVE